MYPGARSDSDRTEDILRAALVCFERHGAARTRMGHIADEVGIPRPHLYRYYESKDALILAVVLRVLEDRAASTFKRIRLRGSAADVLTRAMIGALDATADDSYISLLIRSDTMRDTARVAFETDTVLDALARLWQPILEYAGERGELRAGLDLRLTVRWLSFLLFSFAAIPEMAGSRQAFKVQVETYVLPALLPST